MTEFEVAKVLDNYIKLTEIFVFYGYEIKHNFCCCPFHSEKSPSCKVNDFQFYCFGCGEKGNAISFVKKIFKLNFKEAIRKLCFDFNLGLLNQNLSIPTNKYLQKKKFEENQKKREEEEKENMKNKYFEAWKHFVWYHPGDKPYNLNTPEYLVDDFFNKIDKRFWKAIQTIDELSADAFLSNYKLDEETARIFFTK